MQMQKLSRFSKCYFMENLKISVGCENSSIHFREFCYNEPILQINRRIYEKNLVEILGPMVEKCDILGCFHMERPFLIYRMHDNNRYDNNNDNNKINREKPEKIDQVGLVSPF
jgi:hypothetical protein